MIDEAKVIQSLLSEFEKERALGNKALKQLPRGDLRITRNGPGRISIFREYYYENTRKRKGIGSDKELVYQLAHKAFLQEKLRRLDKNILRLRQMKTGLLSLDPADILAALPKHFDILAPQRVIAARADRRLIYHEHAGYQTDDYQQGLLEKLQLYAAAGIYLGVNLILTFDDENGGINLPLVDALIRDMHHI